MSEGGIVKAGPQATALAEQYTNWTPDQVALIRSQLLGGEGTMDELSLLLHQAQRTGLDPLAKQIYGIFRWDSKARKNKMTIQVGIDGFRSIAEQTGELAGSSIEWCGKDGVWKDVWTGDGYPFAAKCTVWRKGCDHPFTAVARWDEYVQTTKQGHVTRMWEQLSTTMIAKCAESLALRKAFPHSLSGLYTDAEMMQADDGQYGPPPDATPVAAAAPDPDDAGAQVTFQPKPNPAKVNAGVERKSKVVELPDPDSVVIKTLTAKPTHKCAISGRELGKKGDLIAYANVGGKHWMARHAEYLAAVLSEDEDAIEAEFEDVPEGKVNEEQAEKLTRESLAGTPAGELLDQLAGPPSEEAPVAQGVDDDLPN